MEELLALVKQALRLSWLPASETSLLTNQINQGRAFLERYDPAIDWETDHEARGLLIEVVRYIRAGALDEFKTNYFDEILSLTTRPLAKGVNADATEKE